MSSFAGKAMLITGTDTEIGKTRVAASILKTFAGKGRLVAGVKPVASGCARTKNGLRSEDALQLMQYSTVRLPYEVVNPVAYEQAIAPHIAAARAGCDIDFAAMENAIAIARSEAELVVVEGIGGWRVPFVGERDISELSGKLGLPVLLVVGMRLGCINHALLSAEAICRDRCNLVAWVANNVNHEYDTHDETIRTLSHGLQMEPLAVIPHSSSVESLPPQAQDYLDKILLNNLAIKTQKGLS